MYIDGSTYEGSFYNGLRNGQGTFINNYGTYIGNWAHDLKDGDGVLTLPDGSILKGSWKNDKKDGEFHFTAKGSN